MKHYIYADNAATTQLDIDAFEAMKPFLLNEYGNPSQPYAFSRIPKKAIKEARKTIAECIGAEPEEIYFTSCGTESDNWAIKGSILSNSNKCGVITSQIEHHAILNACSSIEKNGHDVKYLPVTESGEILGSALEKCFNDNTRLVSIMFANNEIGTIQPIRILSDISHEHGALFHTDAVQAVGHIEINVKDLGVDMLSASAHKFNGPKGVGFLYVKKGVSISPYLHGGLQENGLRAGTENVASIVGMAVALKKNYDKICCNTKKLICIEKVLLDTLQDAKIDYIRNGSKKHIPGNVNLSFKKAKGEALLHRLDLMGICVSTGSACDSVRAQLSHVIKAISVPPEYAEGTIRISFSAANTAQDAKIIAESLIKILKS